MGAEKPVLCFCGPPDLAKHLGGAFELVAPTAPSKRAPGVALLCRSTYDDLDGMLADHAALALPTLLLIAPAEVEATLERARASDDVSIEGEPHELVAHRLARLTGLGGAGELGRDGLTGLADRATALARLGVELELGPSATAPLSVLLFNVDHFKKLNDTHGHEVGDAALAALAGRLRDGMPDAMMIARYGGESMLALLRLDEASALAAAELTRGLVRARPITGDIKLTVSVGVATAQPKIAREELLKRADRALYSAKADGRDRCVSFEQLERQTIQDDSDVELVAFENVTRVISERLAGFVARRGRKLFRGLKEQADIDKLTELYSRRYLDRRLAFEVSEAHQVGEPLSIAMLDVDHFGEINKTHGWPSGDRVLQRLAQVIGGSVRAGDWVARYGGEEFCLVMLGVKLDDAFRAVERVRNAVQAASFNNDRGDKLHVTVSIGVAERYIDEGEVEPLVERASRCLLAAKRTGRNRVCSGDSALASDSAPDLQTDIDLVEALVVDDDGDVDDDGIIAVLEQ